MIFYFSKDLVPVPSFLCLFGREAIRNSFDGTHVFVEDEATFRIGIEERVIGHVTVAVPGGAPVSVFLLYCFVVSVVLPAKEAEESPELMSSVDVVVATVADGDSECDMRIRSRRSVPR